MSIDRIEALLADQPALPPIERWDPPLSGDIDIVIDREGDWHHEGSRIERQALVNLFASILRREDDGEYYLITPVEKWRIRVEDVPVIAVALERNGEGADQRLLFTLNTGWHIPLDGEHPLVMRGSADSPRPYLTMGRGLAARLARPVYYELVALAEADGDDGDAAWVTSYGERFSLLVAPDAA